MANLIAKPSNELNIRHRKVLDAYFAKRKDDQQFESTKETYVVKSGDTLGKIAKAKGVSVIKIKKENSLKSDLITIGQKLTVSTKKPKGSKVSFERIKEGNLGDEVYIIVETCLLEDVKILLNVSQGIEKGLTKVERPIVLQQNGKDTYIGEAVVGDFAKDTSVTNASEFNDWSIFKVTLGGKDSKKYADILEKLTNKKTSLFLLIDAKSANKGIEVAYNGRNPDKDGELDQRTTPNYWLDMEGKWFELKKNQRAPWMKYVEQEFKKFKSVNEKDSPLKEKISEYFKTTNAKYGKHTTPWCGAFVNWCFQQTKDYKNTNTGLTALAFDWGEKGNEKAKKSKHKPDGWVKGETCSPFYGAVIVLNYSHVAFVVGKNSKKNKYVYLGGNQGSGKSGTQKIQYGSVTIGKEFQILKPKKYKVSDSEKKLKEYTIDKDGSYESTR